jgi:hypothetical protein
MLKIKLNTYNGYQGKDLENLKKSIELLVQTLNGNEFKEKVLNFKSDKTEGGTFHFISYTKWRGRRVDLKRYTNQEIYDIVMKGNETDGTDSYIVFNLTLEKGSGGSTVGYTDSKGNIHTYTTDFQEMSVGQFAAHIFHEYTHTIMFEHSPSNRNDSLRDCYSVPYALGNFIEILTTGENSYGCPY